MRQKRAKAYRKLMGVYSMSFGFRQPYQILLDSEFCTALHDAKFDASKQLHTVLQGEVKPMITQCCIHELYMKGKTGQTVVDLAKTFERRKCNHREPIPGDECLSSVVGPTNKHRYVIGTQSTALRTLLRAIPGLPIIHMNRSVVILEPPSDATLQMKQRMDQEALAPIVSSETKSQSEPPKKKKGPKGPNPLSVKKKQTKEETQPAKKRKRSRVDMLKEDMPSDLDDNDRQMLTEFINEHQDMEFPESWDSLIQKLKEGGGKRRRKRHKREAIQSQTMEEQ